MFSCLLLCLIIFDWMPDIVDFILLGATYFCTYINNLQLCSGVQLSSLEIVWFFGSCFYNLLGRPRAVPSLEIIIPHYWGKTFLNTVLRTPQSMSFSRPAGGLFFVLCEYRVQFHQDFQMVLFLQGQVVPQPCMYSVICILLNTWGRWRLSVDLQDSVRSSLL